MTISNDMKFSMQVIIEITEQIDRIAAETIITIAPEVVAISKRVSNRAKIIVDIAIVAVALAAAVALAVIIHEDNRITIEAVVVK